MRTFDQLLLDMVTYAQGQTNGLTDFQRGSIVRSIFESVAASLEITGVAADSDTEDAINESQYRAWNFERRAANAASGTIRFTATAIIPSSILLPAGTQCRVPGTDKVYRTLAAATFPAGASGSILDVQVVSIGAGLLYNTAATTITELVNPISNLSVSNPSAFTNGRDEETDDERRQRFATFTRSIHRGTSESIEYAAERGQVLDGAGLVIEAVTDSRVVDVGRGYAQCYIINGTTTQATGDLITAAIAEISTYKAAGVTVDVLAAAVIPVVVSLQVKLANTTSLSRVLQPIRDVITAWIARLKISEVLVLQHLEAEILRTPGVIDLVMVAPVANVDPGPSGHVVLSGTATISELA